MKKNLLTGLIWVAATLTTSAQLVEKAGLQYKNASYDVFVIRCDSALLKTMDLVENTGLEAESAWFTAQATQSPFFCITAGVVDSVCMPLGLCIEKGQNMHAVNTGTGTGNFFLKPNGMFVLDSSGKTEILSTEAYTPEPAVVAIQSGPMLLTQGKINTAFDPKSVNRNIRCGVGIYTEKKQRFLVFIKSVTPVSFYAFAEIFNDKFGCSNALNLESGGNCSLHLPTIKKQYSTKTKVCRYLFVKL